ncbi:MAG: hypothetical protein LBB47_08310 [Spirochaetaceae bacterium]|nr:hypothetical protein [Spirochaetaceae bacterium]
MISFTLDEAAKDFEEKFKSNGFKRSILPNSAVDYTNEKQDRDTEAVRDFFATDTLNYIAKLR